MSEIAYLRITSIFNDSRATKEIQTLAKAGNTVHVLAWDRYGNAEEKNKKTFKEYSYVDFLYFKKRIPTGTIGLKNILVLLSWILWVFRTLKRFKHLDVVHACDLDTGISALVYCKKTKCKLVYDIFDYYIDTHKVPCFVKKIVEKKEIEIINFADTTIICTEERKKQIHKAKPKNLVVIHNSPNITKKYDNNIEYDYVYCGALIEKRLIREILEDYPNHSDLKFYFAGYGEYSKKCIELSKKYPNFIYSEPISYEEVLNIESKAKCLSAIYEPSINNHKMCAPNKFYESFALGKPIIVCEGTGIDKVVSATDCGVVIKYNTKEFYDAVVLLCNKKHNSQKQKIFFNRKYQWSIMEKRLLAIYSGNMTLTQE